MKENSLFCLKIDFEKDSKHPERVFKTMTRLIESVDDMQEKLSLSLSLNIKRTLLLHEIQTGSLLTWLKGDTECPTDDEEFKKDDDNEIKIEEYFEKGVKKVIDFTAKKDKINSIEEVHALQDNLHKLALEADIKNIPAYSKISEKDLLDVLLKNNDASKFLMPNDNIYFHFGDGDKKKYNKEFSITQDSISRLLTKKEQIKDETLSLMIKKPAYIGNSMWEFKYSNRSIDAKISHNEWLDKFHERSIILRPGDSLKALVEVKTKYDHNLEVIDTSYDIKEVLDIIEQPYPLENTEMDFPDYE